MNGRRAPREYNPGMRILFLGNSNEFLALPSGAPLRHEIMRAELSADFGEVELITKPMWPTAEFPRVLAKWVSEYSPDLVYLNVAEYWCLYESIPLRIERTFSKLGRPLGKFGRRAAGAPWLAHNPVFRGLRQGGQSIVPGAVYFTPDEVVERVMECVRLCLQDEGMVVVVDGQRGRRPHATTKRWRNRVESRRQFVHSRLRDECARLHVAYGGDDVPQWQWHAEGMDGHRDGLHQADEGQRWMANEAIGLIREALAAVQPPPPAPASRGRGD